MSLSRSHDEAGAITLLRDITTRYPHVLTPRINLANALLHQGQTAEAKTLLEQAEAALTGHDNNPREVVAAVDGLDKVEAADPSWPARRTALLTDTMRRHPDMWELVLISLREPDGAPPSPQALARVKAFAEAHWWHAPAHFKLGCMDAELNRLDDAVTAFRQAARLDVHDDAALAAAAKVCVYGNRWTQAESFQQEAVSRRPDSAQQRLIFARILQRCGDQGQADRQIAAANELMRLARK
jgi:cytochrome c-type biogenesis protein CcmH/NrfG